MTTSVKKLFSRDILQLDAEQAASAIAAQLRHDITKALRRRGAVLGISGGVDSSVSLALAVKALGPERVVGVLLPEHDSSSSSADLAHELAAKFGVETVTENISGALEGFGCYRRRDEAVARTFPEYDPTVHRVKIGLPQNVLDDDQLNAFSLTLVEADGSEQRKRLAPADYLQIMAASNFKQRSRMSMLYYHAELRSYAVIGTANKHEHAQGFFVKYGDGGADVFPLLNLYKTQVYQLAAHLGVPEEIISRPPTADTYSAETTQQEFFFQMPFDLMDLLWYGQENGYSPVEVAAALELTETQVERAYAMFERKVRTTEYLRTPPISDYTTA